MLRASFFGGLTAAMVLSMAAQAADLPDGSAEQPLRVMMVPAETGATDVIDEYGPVFNAITEEYGIHFDARSGESYAAVVQAMCNEQADIAWYGAVTFGQAYDLCGAEILAVDVSKGESVYYSGIFTAADSDMSGLADLAGKSLAVGDPNSTSSFNFPFAMVIGAGVDPIIDLGKIVIAGSHSNSMAALKEGRVDAAAASFNAWEKAVQKGIMDPTKFKVLAKSQPIPNPPLAMHPDLDPNLKAGLKEAFGNIHKFADPEIIRGYGGKKVDGYDAAYPQEQMLGALDALAALTKDLKGEIIEKGGER